MRHIANVTLMRAGTSRGAYYEARCSCGWIGPGRITMRRSYADLDQHEAKHPLNSHDTSTLSEGADR